MELPMSKLLTDNYNFIAKFDSVAADIYQDKKYYYLTIQEIADLRGMAEPEVKYLYRKACDLVKNKEKAWLNGLSNRAKAALLLNKFEDFTDVYNAVVVNNDDLESRDKIGQKVALEIRGWVLGHS